MWTSQPVYSSSHNTSPMRSQSIVESSSSSHTGARSDGDGEVATDFRMGPKASPGSPPGDRNGGTGSRRIEGDLERSCVSCWSDDGVAGEAGARGRGRKDECFEGGVKRDDDWDEDPWVAVFLRDTRRGEVVMGSMVILVAGSVA
jgi:hypothetical protein